MNQVVYVEAGRLKFLILESLIVVGAKHGLETVQPRGTGNPQAVGLKSFKRVGGQGDIEMLEDKRGGFEIGQQNTALSAGRGQGVCLLQKEHLHFGSRSMAATVIAIIRNR